MVDTYLGTHLNTHLVTGCPFDDICRLRATVLRKGPRHPGMHVQCASVPGPMMVHCGGCNAGLRHKRSPVRGFPPRPSLWEQSRPDLDDAPQIPTSTHFSRNTTANGSNDLNESKHDTP
jgi:hypothetical protein